MITTDDSRAGMTIFKTSVMPLRAQLFPSQLGRVLVLMILVLDWGRVFNMLMRWFLIWTG